MNLKERYESFINSLPKAVTLVAVSKTYPSEKIFELYQLGQRDFGENRVQELLQKQATLPEDIRWHCIGHLQTNKVKYVVESVHLIQSVDSLKLLKKIEKESALIHKKTNILLQLKIAEEDSKYGLDQEELDTILENYSQGKFPHLTIKGLMGMATFTSSLHQVEKEFQVLRSIYDRYKSEYQWDTLSMGMSSDYKMAEQCGSTMIRIGSAIFGSRN